MTLLWMLLGCWGANAYIVEGTVVEVSADDEVVLDHEDVPGLMGAMTMPFQVRDPALLQGLEPGHRVIARFEIAEDGGYVTKLRVTGKGPAPERVEAPDGPLRRGNTLEPVRLTLEDGSAAVVGRGQGRPTVLTFLYTRCPIPAFCPATVARFQALQAAADPRVRLLAVTLDPAHDTPEVLAGFARQSGADPAIWRFAVADELERLALAASLPVDRADREIMHGIRVMVFDADGVLRARYDDLDWSTAEVLAAALGDAG